jgi:hypothetical protein
VPVLVWLLIVVAAALGSCGGGGEDSDGVENLLDRAFSREIQSADIRLEATLQLKGSESLDKPVRLEASGPFHTNEGKLPSVDVDVNLATAGGGQTVQTGFLSTGDRAFVKFQDVYYEQPADRVRQANESIRRRGRGGSLRALGLDPRGWLSDARDEGEETVAGVETRHVSGTLDVGRVLNNISAFVGRSAGGLGGATGEAIEPLSREDIRKISEVVKAPTFDVFVGKRDGIIRRVAGRIEFDVPENSRDALRGIEGGSLDFSVEFTDVNGDQRIEAPANARPLSDLTRSLGGGGVLPGRGSGSGAGAPDGSGGAPPAIGDGATPDADDFRRYAECLDEARPQDTEALQRCAELLQR